MQENFTQNAGAMPLEQIPDFALEQLNHADSLLIVCSKKDQAERLYGLPKGRGLALFSLSVAMCTAHRKDTLGKLLFLHRDRPGRTSLALDLMEEMRPCMADRFVLTLINVAPHTGAWIEITTPTPTTGRRRSPSPQGRDQICPEHIYQGLDAAASVRRAHCPAKFFRS